MSGALLAPPAAADPPIPAGSGSMTVRGTGFGHGWGMSQYGAYGAARQGKSWPQILAFYYPGTRLGSLPTGTAIRVWISADTDGDLRVQPSPGLRLTSAGSSFALPTGSKYRTWRVTRSGTGYRLSYRGTAGGWTTQRTPLGSSTWSFASSAKLVKVVLPGGAVREYRGTVALAKRGSSGRTVNRLAMEAYLRSVVPAEMPTSWSAHAVRAQAVAARSYAAWLKAAGYGRGYDTCDTVNCQVYAGYAATTGGRRHVYETRNGNAAVQATANRVLTYRGRVAFTQFSSSNGGHSATGSQPYLRARRDPYDGVVRSQAWTRTIATASIGRIWAVGRVRSVQVASRDGAGPWGGRVRQVKIVGSRRSVTVSGAAFRYRLGMRSDLFTVVASPPAPTLRPGRVYATFPRSYSANSRADLAVVSRGGYLLRFPVVRGRLGAPATIGSGFGAYSHVVNAGDWNGDGYQDVIVRNSRDRLLLLRGTRTGRLAPGVDMRVNAHYRALTSVGDANGDRRPDLVVLTRAGNLWIVYGDGRTGRARSVRLATGWRNRDWLRGPGDLTGDGRPDLLSKAGGTLYLHPGTRTGFGPGRPLGTSWRGITTITSIGDFDGDRRADVVARTASGQLRLYRGDGRGRLLAPSPLNGRFAGTRFAI